MTDPWPDVREMLDKATLQIEPTSFTLDGRALRLLLTDADALLAFKDRIQKFDKGMGKETLLAIARVYENSGLPSEDVARRRGMWLRDLGTMIEEALAALPENLK